jgi:hypothetical protein
MLGDDVENKDFEDYLITKSSRFSASLSIRGDLLAEYTNGTGVVTYKHGINELVTASLKSSTGTFNLFSSGGITKLNNDDVSAGRANMACVANNSNCAYTFASVINIKQINVISGWEDNSRFLPNVTISYGLKNNPDDFIELFTLQKTFTSLGNPPWVFCALTRPKALIMTNVATIKFAFGTQQSSGAGYIELQVIKG